MQLIQWIKSLFRAVSHQDYLEQFLRSKRPSNTAEVEYWIQHYELNRRRELL